MEINANNKLTITHLNDVSQLADFNCGIDEMDVFIHNDMHLSLQNHYCNAYIVHIGDTPVAMFALGFDSLTLDADSVQEMRLGQSANKPDVSQNYCETFFSKLHYPALEISYIAIDKKYRNMGIGSTLVDEIARMALNQDMAGCMFLTVEAYKRHDYSAVGFYNKCRFEPCELPNPNKTTLRMFRALYPQP